MAAIEGKTFEEALQRLEEIVSLLEGDAPSLEQSLALFEEGKLLIASCTKKLESAEQKLKVIAPLDSP